VLAALFLFAHQWLEWQTAHMVGAGLPFVSMLPPLIIAVLTFPAAAWIVSRIDRWRLGR
jgi:hypothetical protein